MDRGILRQVSVIADNLALPMMFWAAAIAAVMLILQFT